MNILVAGSAGMIGGYVVKGLLEKGHTVIGVDRRENDNVNPNDNRLTQIVLDVGSKDDVNKVFELIYNLLNFCDLYVILNSS